jgi:predicted FMN-binding regulatory protein PaiB
MDDAAVRDLLHRHGAADLVTATPAGLIATMLPFVYDPRPGPPAFVAGQLRAIVGVELLITRIQAKAKMSQNRPEAVRAARAAVRR